MSTIPDSTSMAPDMTWDVATLFPRQGQWSDTEYLNLTDDLNRLVELTHGRLEILEMPTTSHQQIVFKLVQRLFAFVEPRKLGTALMAPLRVRLQPGVFRAPDVVFASTSHQHFIQDDFWTGADLVMEVVSAGPKSRRRDFDEKRSEYSAAGIAEYWIIDPLTQTILLLELLNSRYELVGEFGINEIASSRLLTGFTVAVNDVFHLPPA